MEPIKTKSNASDSDGFYDRVVKLIPAEIVVGYIALIAVVGSISKMSLEVALPVALISCVALIVLTLRNAGKRREPPRLQYLFSVLAFLAWAFAIRDPLAPFGIATPPWIPAFGCVLVPLFGAYVIGFTTPTRATTRGGTA